MTSAPPRSVTFWLQQWRSGEPSALDELTQLVYTDLRRLAAKYIRDEGREHTLQATALVHELYLRISSFQEIDWTGRGQFISAAAQSMRRILIDHARKRRAAKRERVDLAQGTAIAPPINPDVLDIDSALRKMVVDYPRHARIVELRFFGGLDLPEIAKVLDLSLRTVERDWHFAKAWLNHELSGA
jgi:RNA polymerase sigma factor (TIGR02999 family)